MTPAAQSGGADGAEWLLADIGGTSVRLALAGPSQPPCALAEHPCAQHAGPEEAIATYLAATGARPRAACVAVAGPVGGDEVALTNSAWRFSREALRLRFRLDRLLVLNDFEALALALPALGEADLHRVGPHPAAAAATQPMLVLGPGTGLGVAALVPCAGGWTALPGEGGHAGFAPQDDLERAIAEVLRRQCGRVSNETLLSGAGLVSLYGALSVIEGRPAPAITPAEVTRLALEDGDARAERALGVFFAVLGAVAGDMALVTGARGGVFIGGGIVPRLISRIGASAFRQRFEDKGAQRDYAAAIATSVIVARAPALAGAQAALHAALR